MSRQQNCRENHKFCYLRELTLEFPDVTEVCLPKCFISVNIESLNSSLVPSLKVFLLHGVSDSRTVLGASSFCKCKHDVLRHPDHFSVVSQFRDIYQCYRV
jgi:hypothetical protein